MPRATYSYIGIDLPPSEPYPQGHTIYRPCAFAIVTASNGKSYRQVVLPDSGADSCMFPLRLATILEIDVSQLAKALTAGVGSSGNVTYYDHVDIDLGQGIVFKAYAGFSEAMDAQGIGLLGQNGLFSNFHVQFLHSQGIFTIETP